MQVGITGATGDIGSFLAAELTKCTIIDKIVWLKNKRKEIKIGHKFISHSKLEGVDLDDFLVRNYDILFHCAGTSDASQNCFFDNLKLYEKLSKLNVGKFVFLSSVNVYGNVIWSDKEGLYQEDHMVLPTPISEYAASKVALENIIKVQHSNNLILRCCGITSPFVTHGPYYHHIENTEKGYKVFCARPIIPVILLIKIIAALAITKRIVGTYNIVGNENFYFNEKLHEQSIMNWTTDTLRQKVSNKKLVELIGPSVFDNIGNVMSEDIYDFYLREFIT